ncbi:MAG: S8 family serine peptidase [Actinomycetota bacterium]
MRRFLAAMALTAVGLSWMVIPAAGPAVAQPLAKVEGRVSAAVEKAAKQSGTVDLVLSLKGIAGSKLKGQLASLGTWSWAFQHVPVAAVRLPAGRLDLLRRIPEVEGIYLDRQLDYYLDGSAKVMNTARAWNDLKVTGKGVTVAVLDTGVDFTHPDLAPAMKGNVKLVGIGAPLPAVPVDVGPNSDTSSGHGTHCAGDVAARGTQSGGAYKGMAPEASLVGVGSGDALFVFTAVEGFDYVLANRQKWDIKVVSNSWGTDFEPFDPQNPVNVATKAAADAGLAVVFAMGNSYDELTMNPYAAAPWVIPVAAGTKEGGIADFTSGGFEADTVGFAFDGADVSGETRSPLNMGLYHPAVTSTGVGVISTRANNTMLPLLGAPDDISLPPEQIPYYTTMSGTSMATPETAGVVALILQANPSLNPYQVRKVLEATAAPIKGVPFWKQGYGYTDASAAVELALSLKSAAAKGLSAGGVDQMLSDKHAARDGETLEWITHPKRAWAWNAEAWLGPGSVEHTVKVPQGTARMKVVSNGPSTVEANAVIWDITVTDSKGQTVGATNAMMPNIMSGTAVLDIDLTAAGVPYDNLGWGDWKVVISSDDSPAVPASGLPVTDDLPKSTIAIVAAIFDAPKVSCVPAKVFVAKGQLSLRLQDDTSGIAPYPLNPAYTYVGPVPDGKLANRKPARNLAGTFGVINTEVPGPEPRFYSDPLTAPLVVGHGGVVEVWVQAPQEAEMGGLSGSLLDVAPDGSAKVIATVPGDVGVQAGTAAPAQTKGKLLIAGAYTVPAGHRLGLSIGQTFIGTTADTLFYDSDEFPSGVTVTTGNLETKDLCGLSPGPKAAGAKETRSLPATGGAGAAVAIGLLALGACGLRWKGARRAA